jgi:hypothetical protein
LFRKCKIIHYFSIFIELFVCVNLWIAALFGWYAANIFTYPLRHLLSVPYIEGKELCIAHQISRTTITVAVARTALHIATYTTVMSPNNRRHSLVKTLLLIRQPTTTTTHPRVCSWWWLGVRCSNHSDGWCRNAVRSVVSIPGCHPYVLDSQGLICVVMWSICAPIM